MLRIRVNIFPKGGYRFRESDGTIIVGDSWRGVTVRVAAYRKRNKIPAGDPAREINDQKCQSDPSACFRADDGVNAAAIKVTNLKSRVLQWFSGIRKVGKRGITDFASAELAAQRANVCASCPQNQSLPQGCSSCLAAVKELRTDVIGGRAADGRLTARGCNILGAELATQCWLDLVTVENSDLPSCCWRRRSP